MASSSLMPVPDVFVDPGGSKVVITAFDCAAEPNPRAKSVAQAARSPLRMPGFTRAGATRSLIIGYFSPVGGAVDTMGAATPNRAQGGSAGRWFVRNHRELDP